MAATLALRKWENFRWAILKSRLRVWYQGRYLNTNGVFNTSISVKLQHCLNEKDIRQEISRNLKRAILQNLYWETSVVESVLNTIARRDSRLATILKRNFHQGGFFCKDIRIASVSSERPSLNDLIKTLAHYFFSKRLYLRQLDFGTYSGNILCWSPFMVELHLYSVDLQLNNK